MSNHTYSKFLHAYLSIIFINFVIRLIVIFLIRMHLDELQQGERRLLVADDEIQPQNVVDGKKKKKRGPTRMGMVQSRIKITFNERGQPVAENSSKLSSYLGVIAREHIPIVIDNWRKVDEEIKQQLWELVQQRFIWEGDHKDIIFKMLNNCWRIYKSRKTAEIIEANEAVDRSRALNNIIRPQNLRSNTEWEAFVKKRLSDEFKAKSNNFRKMRKKQKLSHTMGRKGYARMEDDMKKERKLVEIPREDVWTKGHLRKDGKPINEAVSETLVSITKHL
ncbi:hypothetical protein UlMin_001326 [Ulmus minor]